MVSTPRTSEASTQTLDDVLNSIGGFGWYQQRLVLICGVSLGAVAQCYNSYLFVGRAAPCQHHPQPQTFDREELRTYSAEFHLVCADTFINALITSVSLAGFGVGSYYGGGLATKYGRNGVAIVSHVCALVLHINLAFVGSVPGLFVVRSLLGVFVGAHTVSLWTLTMEFIGTKYRSQAGGAIWVIWALMMCLNSLFAWISESRAYSFPLATWRVTTLMMSTPAFIAMLFFVWLPTSPRLLLLHGQQTDVFKVLQEVAATNRQKMDISAASLKCSEPAEPEGGSSQITTMCDLMMCDSLIYGKPLNKVFCLMAFLWIAVVVTYYGISINIAEMSGNVYVNNLLSCLLEIPAYAMTGISLEAWGRRRVMSVMLSACAGACIIIAIMVSFSVSSAQVLAFVAKFCVTLAFSALYVWATELFPTNVRSLAYGCLNTFARGAGIAAPLVACLSVVWVALPSFVFGTMAAFAAFASELLPETQGQPLMEKVYWSEKVPIRS